MSEPDARHAYDPLNERFVPLNHLGQIPAIGDVNSTERGSGARDNAGKPDWSLMPVRQLRAIVRHRHIIAELNDFGAVGIGMLSALADFQESPSEKSAHRLLICSVAMLWAELPGKVLTEALVPVVRVWEHGQKEYAAWNWMKGMAWSIPVACILRHWAAIENGESLDTKVNGSGQLHSAHIVCNAMMLNHYVPHFPEGNDMPHRWFKP